MTCPTSNLTIQKGKTFSRVLRWEAGPFIYKAITAITRAAPAVVTAVGHGLPDGWRAAILSPGGMREIAAKTPGKGEPPVASEFRKITYIDADSFSLNDVNSLEFTAYTSGGAVIYYTPVDLADYTARMQVRATDASDTVLLSLTTENSRIAIDDAAKTITLTINAVDTAAIDFLEGTYDLEMVSPGAIVTQLLKGSISVEEETTR